MSSEEKKAEYTELVDGAIHKLSREIERMNVMDVKALPALADACTKLYDLVERTQGYIRY